MSNLELFFESALLEFFDEDILKKYNAYPLEILVNARPKFMCRLELDFYIPKLKLAYEVQGYQHFDVASKFNMNTNGLIKRIIYDIQKNILCKREGIYLINVCPNQLTSYNLWKIMKSVTEHHTFVYQDLICSLVENMANKCRSNKAKYKVVRDAVITYLNKYTDFNNAKKHNEAITAPIRRFFQVLSGNITETTRKIVGIDKANNLENIKEDIKKLLKSNITLDEVIMEGINYSKYPVLTD